MSAIALDINPIIMGNISATIWKLGTILWTKITGPQNLMGIISVGIMTRHPRSDLAPILVSLSLLLQIPQNCLFVNFSTVHGPNFLSLSWEELLENCLSASPHINQQFTSLTPYHIATPWHAMPCPTTPPTHPLAHFLTPHHSFQLSIIRTADWSSSIS